MNAERSCCATSARTDGPTTVGRDGSRPTPAVDKPSAAFRLIRPFSVSRARVPQHEPVCVRRAASRARTASQTRLPRRLLAEKRQRPRRATGSDCVKLRRARESPLLERIPLHAHARISDPKPRRNQNAKRDSSKALKRRFSQLRFQIRVCIRACIRAPSRLLKDHCLSLACV